MTYQSRSQSQPPSQPLSDEERALATGYVLGDLSEAERQQIKTLLKHRPEVRQEVDALTVSLRSLPQSLPPMAPPPSLEAKILSAYETAYETTYQTTTATQAQPTQVQPTQARPTPQRPNSPTPQRSNAPTPAPPAPIPWSKIIAGIATLAALWLGTSNARLRYQLAQINPADMPDADRVVEILQQPTSRLVSLQGRAETNTATAGGTLLFQKGQWQEVVVSLNNLPPLPVEQVYRMWLTMENGGVIFCGEFNTSEDGTVLIRLTPPELPPQGVKTTGLFVTQNAASDPLSAMGMQLMVGEI